MTALNLTQSLKAAGLTPRQIQAATAAAHATAVASEAAQDSRAWAAGVAAGRAIGERLKALRGQWGAGPTSAPHSAPPRRDGQLATDWTAEVQIAAEAAGASASAYAEGTCLARRLKAIRGKAYRWQID